MLQRTIFVSDLVALSTGEEFKAAMLLYNAAYDQIPAGSLPNDDRLLSFLSRTGAQWTSVKDMALRGWVLCSDGRLYHRVSAEKALLAWIGRLKQRAAAKAGGAGKNHRPPSADIAILRGQIAIALEYLGRIAPESRELVKWLRQSAGGNAGGGAGGTPPAVPMLCQGEGEGEASPEDPDQKGGIVIPLGGARS